MQIEYLKSYNENKTDNRLKKDTPEGMSELEIEALELEINSGKKFPKAFREYLFIGGKWSCLSMNDGNYTGKTRKVKELLLKYRGISINRPFVAYHSNNEGYSFSIIYLDEGDDPQPWKVSIDGGYDSDEGEEMWKCPQNTFSEQIDIYVYYALNNYAP